jgi:hypothetical protein
MSTNKDTVRRYLDGFRTANSEQILSCLTEDIEWTVFGWFLFRDVDLAHGGDIRVEAGSGVNRPRSGVPGGAVVGVVSVSWSWCRWCAR